MSFSFSGFTEAAITCEFPIHAEPGAKVGTSIPVAKNSAPVPLPPEAVYGPNSPNGQPNEPNTGVKARTEPLAPKAVTVTAADPPPPLKVKLSPRAYAVPGVYSVR